MADQRRRSGAHPGEPMAVDQKLAKKLAEHLESGETLLGAAKVQYKGGANFAVGLGGLALQGARAVAGRGEKPIDGIAQTVPADGKAQILGITDRRLVFLTTGLGKSKPIGPGIPVAHLSGIEAAEAKVMLAKLTLSFRDGSAVTLDLHTDKAVQALNELGGQLASG